MSSVVSPGGQHGPAGTAGGGGAQPTNISRLAHQAAGGVLGRAYPCPHGMGLFQQPSEPSWGRDRVATSSAREHRTSV